MFALLFVASAASIAGSDLIASSPRPSRSETIRLRPDQLLAFAEMAESKGDIRTAAAAYDQLSHDPNSNIRNEARFRKAKLLEARGQLASAAFLLRQVLDEKPAATPVRLELAGILDKLGDKEGAWRQVRAAQAAGLPPAVARLVDRYSQALRAQKPFGASVEVALAPDSNINHATQSETLSTVIGDFHIGDEGKAQSGIGISLSGQAYRRLPLGRATSFLCRLSGSGNLYRKRQFNDIVLDLGCGPEFELGASRLNAEVGATQRWFGQASYMRSARIGAVGTAPVGRKTQVRVSVSSALVDNQVNKLEDGKDFAGQVSVERALSPTLGLAVTGSAMRESLRDPGYSTTSWRLGLLGWKDFGRMTLTADAEFGRLSADDRLALFPDKRHERYSRMSLGATFRRLEFHGFAPVARLSFERNRSSIAFYDFRRTRTELGFERAF